MDPKEKKEKKPHRPFQDTIEKLKRDGLPADCDDAVSSVIQAVMTTGLKGKVTLTLEFTRRQQNQIVIAGQVTKQLPKAKPLPVTFYATTGGELLENNPDQPEFAEVVRLADHKSGSVEKVS